LLGKQKGQDALVGECVREGGAHNDLYDKGPRACVIKKFERRGRQAKRGPSQKSCGSV